MIEESKIKEPEDRKSSLSTKHSRKKITSDKLKSMEFSKEEHEVRPKAVSTINYDNWVLRKPPNPSTHTS